jgi:hypothetical protein
MCSHLASPRARGTLNLASKVELPPVRGSGYESTIAILSHRQRKRWSPVEASSSSVVRRRRGHIGTEDYHQNGYENHSTYEYSCRKRAPGRMSDITSVDPMPSRTIGHFSGALQNFHPIQSGFEFKTKSKCKDFPQRTV